MCGSKAKILDPAGLLTGKNAKYADPLGITKTAIGDPTGDLRKERSRIAAEKEAERLAAEDAKNVLRRPRPPPHVPPVKRLPNPSTNASSAAAAPLR
ncbi:hypothetical protein SNK04_014299 [Fusarium graminearum]